MSQQTLPGYELSEADLVQIALDQPLDAKIDRAKLLLQEYVRAALKLSPDGYYLAFSGGKDSCVIKQLAIEAGVSFKAWYNLTTIDPPELVQYIKRHHADVGWNRQPVTMMKRLVDRTNGPPTRLARWCCEEYKEQGGYGTLKIIGVRIAESARRAKLWREYVPHRKSGAILAPIAYWTDADVWAFIRSRNLPYCELYDQGFKRLGCVGCPMAGPNMQAIEFARWPKIEARWKRACFRFWDRWHGVPTRKGERRFFEDFGSAQGLWDWWRSGKASEGAAECHQQEMDLQR
jgi:phosphoadenosine phosphosulfate reductase